MVSDFFYASEYSTPFLYALEHKILYCTTQYTEQFINNLSQFNILNCDPPWMNPDVVHFHQIKRKLSTTYCFCFSQSRNLKVEPPSPTRGKYIGKLSEILITNWTSTFEFLIVMLTSNQISNQLSLVSVSLLENIN